jgi:hypothetical protein
MKSAIPNLIAVAALSFSGATLAAGEPGTTMQPPAMAASAVQPAAAAKPAQPSPAQQTQPAANQPASGKHVKTNTVRPKDQDLRHCLELGSNAAIAKCAGE